MVENLKKARPRVRQKPPFYTTGVFGKIRTGCNFCNFKAYNTLKITVFSKLKVSMVFCKNLIP